MYYITKRKVLQAHLYDGTRGSFIGSALWTRTARQEGLIIFDKDHPECCMLRTIKGLKMVTAGDYIIYDEDTGNVTQMDGKEFDEIYERLNP